MSYKVLIVEDDPMVSMINERYVCKNRDFVVAGSCRNGREALKFLDCNEVDLVVLDVFMPYMDGIETLKKIREKKLCTEVVMVTAANDSRTIEETMHLGVLDYLIKPFSYERLQAALEKFVAKTNALRDALILDQNDVDSLLLAAARPERKTYPKGIQEKTLKTILDFFVENSGWHSTDMVSEKLNISIVTVRHYLNYLAEHRRIEQDMNYETGGRPCILYRSV